MRQSTNLERVPIPPERTMLMTELPMQVTEVATVSAGRMFGSGVAHVLVGLTWSVGPILGFMERAGEAGDVRAEVIAIVLLLWPVGVPIFLRGVGLLQQSFGASGYFRATTDGLELRLGAPSLYARLMRIVPTLRILPANPDTFPIRFPDDGASLDEAPGGRGFVYRFPWTKIASFDVSMFAVVIELRSGARLLLRRFYFTQGPIEIGRRLNEITQRLRVTNPLPNP
jgi:hypothetical protein